MTKVFPRKLFYLFLLANFVFSNSDIVILPEWNLNDKADYSIYNKKVETKNKKSVTSYSTKRKVSIHIIDKTENDYTFQLVFNTLYYSNFNNFDLSIQKALYEEINGIKIELLLSKQGDIVDIKNWDEIKAPLDDAREKAIGEIKKLINNQATIDNINNQYKRFFNVKENALNILRTDLDMILFPIGRRYVKEKKYRVNYTLPNITGGAPLPARGYYSLRSIDGDIYEVVLSYAIDKKKSASLLTEIMNNLPQNPELKQDKDLFIQSVDISEKSKYKFNFKENWTERVTHLKKNNYLNEINEVTTIINKR